MSTKIKWGKKFELGVEDIDVQHKRWIEILNRFIDARQNGKEKEILQDILKEIVDYTRYHFETEEQHMQEHNYQLLSKHKQQHASLVSQIGNVIKTLNINETKAVVSLENLLKNWVLKHILTYDKMYGEYLKQLRTEQHEAEML